MNNEEQTDGFMVVQTEGPHTLNLKPFFSANAISYEQPPGSSFQNFLILVWNFYERLTLQPDKMVLVKQRWL